MLYNGFVVVDTRDSTGTETGYCGEPSYVGEPGGDKTPLFGLGGTPPPPVFYGPGGGGNTPPELPPTGQTGGGKFSWLTPDVLTAGLGVLGSVAGMAAARKASQSPDVSRIKAVCGRKPLFNGGGKKDRYFACVDKLMTPQQQFVQQPAGMSTSTKIIIGVLVFLVLMAIVITVIMISKRKAVPVKA